MKLKVNLDKVAVLFLPWLQLILWSLATLLMATWVVANIVKGQLGLFGTLVGLAMTGYFTVLAKGLVDELKEEYRRYEEE